jgi:gastric intrinsic factor
LQCDNVIRDTNGNGENGENGNGEKIAPLPGVPGIKEEETDQKNISFTYTLWLESNISEIYSLQLTALKNTSFFKAMTIAAELEKRHNILQYLLNFLFMILTFYRFSFEAREWPNGHYIHTLAGKKEEPTL